eukprot:1727679-Rhodomonas_salina.1
MHGQYIHAVPSHAKSVPRVAERAHRQVHRKLTPPYPRSDAGRSHLAALCVHPCHSSIPLQYATQRSVCMRGKANTRRTRRKQAENCKATEEERKRKNNS